MKALFITFGIVIGVSLVFALGANYPTLTLDATGRCSQSVDFTGTTKIKGATIGTAATTDTTAYATAAQGTLAANALPNASLKRGRSAAMVDGKVVVLNSAAAANSIILLTQIDVDTPGFIPTGSLGVDSITAGWGFEIASSSATDTAVVNWMMISP